ncbi:MAG: helix-turn-helix domain-containing protein [Candidatus Omnitrophota bacterium]
MKNKVRINNEIEKFIVEQKKLNSSLSCRALSSLIADKFNQKISKSSINQLLKEKGLSSAIGRPVKAKSKETSISFEVDCAGAYFLKGMDELVSLSLILRQFSRNVLPNSNSKVMEYKNNVALYSPVFHPAGLEKLDEYSGNGLWQISSEGNKFHKSSIIRYLEKIEQLDIIPNIMRGIELGIDFVNLIAIQPKNGPNFFIDPGCHLIWFKPVINLAYTLPIIKAQELISDVLFNNKPLILLSSRPYQPLVEDLVYFFKAWNGEPDYQMKAVRLLDVNANQVYRIDKVPLKRRDFIFAVLPWQIPNLRLPERKNIPMRVNLGPFLEEFILESSELNFTQRIDNKSLKLRTILLNNTSLHPRLCLFTNIPNLEKSDAEIADSFLQRWPNMEEGFEDMLKKAEYASLGKSYNINNINKLRINFPQEELDFKSLFLFLLENLNKFCQLRFFPSTSQIVNFQEMREKIYSLPGMVSQTEKAKIVHIKYPSGFAFQSGVSFACRRFNEDEIFINNKRIFLLPKASN